MILTNYDLLLSNETIHLFIVVLVAPSSISSDPVLFYSIFFFEIFNLLLSFCSFWSIVYTIPKFHLYHRNIIRIIQLYFGSYYVTIFSRAITMSFQLGLLPKIAWTQNTGSLGSLPSDYFLLITCVIRIMFTAQYASIVPAMLAERVCATLFVTDYENRTRSYIAYFIYGLSICYTMAAAWIITSGNLSFTFCVSILIIGVVTIGTFVIFYSYNKQKLKDLSSSYHSSSYYSLSIRYQVTENIKVMKQILIMTILISFFVLVASVMSIFCFVIYDFFSFEGQVIAALLEMWVAFSANVIAFFLFLLNKNWSNTTMRSLFIGRNNARVEEIKTNKHHQTDMYFEIFSKQW